MISANAPIQSRLESETNSVTRGRSLQRDPSHAIYAHLPFWIWVSAALLMFWGTTTSNPWLTPFAIFLLPFFAQLLWRRGEPPVLVFACAMQWLQAAGAIFYADFYHQSLFDAFGGPELEQATWLSLIGVLSFALGMRIALFRARTAAGEIISREALGLNVKSLFTAYIVTFIVSTMAGAVAFSIPAVTQLLFAFGAVKWACVFLLAYCSTEQRTGYGLLAVCVVLEFVTGLLGYFATFKNVFFVLLVVALTSPGALKGVRVYRIGLIAGVLVALSIVWSAVKSDYREFINQGFGMQEVSVPVGARMTELADLVGKVGWNNVAEGMENIALRVSYVHYFALTIGNVPRSLPYENGALWLGALKHVVTPRVLFPEKETIDDSERSSLYTGTAVTGADRGTSISLGYIAESYIDFGPVFMFAPILLLGTFFGLIYRSFIVGSRFKLLGAGIASAILIFGAYNLETSNIKILGGVGIVLLLMSVLYKGGGQWICNSLRK